MDVESVTVLDVVSTTGIGMTADAVLARRDAAICGNTACDDIQVNGRVGQTGRGLAFDVDA